MSDGATRRLRRLRVGAVAMVLALACERDLSPPAPEPSPETTAPAAQEPAPPAPPPPAVERPAPAPARPPAPPPRELPESAPPEAVAPPAAEPLPLDLEALERRLKETRALGVFTKLALKGDIEDLLEELDAYHERGRGRLAALHERFELLVMKVISLLQDDDPDLADALARSRDGLWKILADPEQFARLST